MGIGVTMVSATELMPLIRAWRLNEAVPVTCPCCATPALEIADRSARPYAEWYVLTCGACGLDATINIPLGPPVAGAD